ncbi:MAG: ATP-binding protein [Actinomycetota bacterium]
MSDTSALNERSHVVQFYESEPFLVESVRDFIAPGLAREEAAILICTPEHLDAFEDAFERAGIDLDAARTSGRYVGLDARTTLDSFMVNGAPDPERFFEVVGAALDGLSASDRPVHAFGEMVALLWDEGAVAAAIRLEELWNELAQIRSFRLMCAYPIGASPDVGTAERFAEICERHSHVVPAESYTALSEMEKLSQVSLLQQRTASERSRREKLERDQAILEEAVQKLKDLDRMRNEFVAMVVHDIRTPNAVVTGFLSLLRDNWAQLSPDRIDELLSRAIENTSHISGLVTDMLTAARIDSGEFTFEVVPFDLAEVIYRTVGPVRDTNSSIRFEVEIPPGLPRGYGDAGRQQQILNNLLSNAVKFSPPGSTVVVSAEKKDGSLAVSVRDEGSGISSLDQAKLFKRFSRLESRSHVKGTGLGLYISKALVEGQGGTISVDSTPGRGSTFTYTVPIAD